MNKTVLSDEMAKPRIMEMVALVMEMFNYVSPEMRAKFILLIRTHGK